MNEEIKPSRAVVDDYQAKYAMWAAEPRVYPLPKMVLPFKVPSRRFDSYEEFNAWKAELLLEIARRGGVKWTN